MSFDYLTVYRQFIYALPKAISNMDVGYTAQKLRDGIIADDRDEKYKCIDKFNTMFNSAPYNAIISPTAKVRLRKMYDEILKDYLNNFSYSRMGKHQ